MQPAFATLRVCFAVGVASMVAGCGADVDDGGALVVVSGNSAGGGSGGSSSGGSSSGGGGGGGGGGSGGGSGGSSSSGGGGGGGGGSGGGSGGSSSSGGGGGGSSSSGGGSGGSSSSGGGSGSGGIGGSSGSSGSGGSSGSSGNAGSKGGSGGNSGSGGSSGSSGSSGQSCAVTGAPVLTYTLAKAPFPSSAHPSVAVHVPAGFKPCERPGLVVFFHGFNNCVANVIGSVDGECTPGDGTRSALFLSEQLDASKANAILVAVQLSFDQATGAPGALTKTGGLRALLDELFDQHLSAAIGAPIGVDDLDRVVLASHSGGYWATAVSLASGNVPRVTEVQLYDSLYGEEAKFRAWVDVNLARFDVTRTDTLRFNTVYTVGGGTLDNAQAMSAWVEPKLAAKGLTQSLLDDPTTATLDEPAFDHPLIFKRSGLSHNDVPRYYFERMVRHAGFLSLP